ncbi:diguanylate cyclase [Aquabacterium sp. OR-4]|uniref:diguanylate cyclase n=1 Tax=Aquabacterium sp. OR-4 TaxID=2978127 RepID=UPI0021B4CB8B|nr:diguanylate cyclase [Aquabacterium sp. OR-4]MDT7835054.1 diguanylate cyclase [Aquabacterium sp. OR-4]
MARLTDGSTDETPPDWAAAPGPVLLIEPDPRRAIGMVRALSALARVRLASGLTDGLAAAALERPELLLVSDTLPEADLAVLRQRCLDEDALAQVPLMVMLSQADERAEIAALDLGAVACLPRQATPALVAARVRATLELLRSASYWRQSAQFDALTGLANRRQLDAVLQREWRRAQRLQRPLALLMVDLDFFKAYNDRHGHLAGDDCLRQVAQLLRQAVRRPTDLVGRFGGEEFAVLLSETDGRGALVVADLLQRAVADQALPHGGRGAGPRVSVSIGVSAWAPGAGDPGAAALLACADAALYDVKRHGRDGVAWRSLARQPAPEPTEAAHRRAAAAPMSRLSVMARALQPH